MGRYLNPANIGFRKVLNSPIYVDKTGMISKLNKIIGTSEPMVCVSRPRRFGKSTAISMLTAYYSRGCESGDLFEDCEISKADDYGEHLNQYDVIRMDMQLMMSEAGDMVNSGSYSSVFTYIRDEVEEELNQCYPGCAVTDVPLSKALWNVYETTGRQFILLVDEWDAIFRNTRENLQFQKEYIEFLRGLYRGGSREIV